ncbi:hypothetical protein CQ010_02045 [Arthrobacter sp. MYb211]|uniref:RDD family protein n=1 Tax=unclassified Arthrobacter TaxID=235627 RepID=UPI000CFD1A5F|nr:MULTISPECIES: RDD family protein [unclassified Arthrobacter]PRA13449.1 hypothetical protein CQ015_04300 [Arthrobacter sp. MYb221]PRC10647.1 hypothetical protein CQ010_02045 [Arthrobacter sp. MYb211]
MAATLNLVDASAVKRLGAWLVDNVPLAVLATIFLPWLGAKTEQAALSGDGAGQIAGIWLLFVLLSVAYTAFLWWWEATQGKTLGNIALGIRTTDMQGHVPGWGPVIVRRLLIALAGIVPLAGPVLMVVSNLFDSNGKRQGWHDQVANSLVMDVKAGRDPLSSGGVHGPQSFAPEEQSVEQPAPGQGAQPQDRHDDSHAVIDSVPGAARTREGQDQAPETNLVPAKARPSADAPSPANAAGPLEEDQPAAQTPAGNLAEEESGHTRLRSEVPSPANSAGQPEEGQPAEEPAAGQHADEESGHTQLRSEASPEVRLVLDDGEAYVLGESALLGRNPAADDGEAVQELIVLIDPDRSVSKTHLLVQRGTSGVWVTDRNSSNGSLVQSADGSTQQVAPGQPVQVKIGETVVIGDRSFKVEGA